jgi:hypothetical protein
VGERGLFEAFFGSSHSHDVECPCGATLSTDDKELVKQFIEAHKGHEEPD